MRTLPLIAAFSFVPLAAQQPGTAPTTEASAADATRAAAARLQKSLATTATLPSCGFHCTWGPPAEKDKKEDGGEQAAVGGGAVVAWTTTVGSAPGDATGTWLGNDRHVVLGGDELLFRGGRMIARDAGIDWQVRSGHFADGNSISFVPDVQRLLSELAAMKLRVVHREPGSIDDRPVEVVTVELDEDQVAQLTWNELLPPAGGTGGIAQILRARVAFVAGPGGAIGGGAARPAAPKPTATVDVAFHVDPGTGFVHRVHLRSHDDSTAQMGGGRVMILAGPAGGAQVAKIEDTTDGEEDEKDQKAATAAPKFEAGLPVRSRKNKAVVDFVVDFAQHGAARLPTLTDRAKDLLSR